MAADIEMRAQAAPWRQGVSLWIRQGSAYAINLVMEEKRDFVAVDPSLSISETAAQTLMDDLWSAGIRPTEAAGSAGAMRRAESHISDLRAIAFKLLKVEGAPTPTGPSGD